VFTSIQVKNLRSIDDSGRLPLGPITVVIGANNAGKSTLLRAVAVIQDNTDLRGSDVRVGAQLAEIELGFTTLPMIDHTGNLIGDRFGVGETQLRVAVEPDNISLFIGEDDRDPRFRVRRAPSKEPLNIVYPIFSARTPPSYQQQTNSDIARSVFPTDNNIVARVRRLAGLDFAEAVRFRELCTDILGVKFDVLDTPGGSTQQLGVAIGLDSHIPIEAMGAGLSSTLNLLATLSTATGKVILIEEPENDLHPAALKRLLDEMVKSAAHNQFIITTHSSVVLTRLGASEDSVVLHITKDGHMPPRADVKVAASPEERLGVLSDLGYELPDLALQDGWMIFEESSAERLIKQYLAKWFAPALLRLTFIGARGDSRVAPLMNDYREMLLFSHLSSVYRGRAWVILDAGKVGEQIVKDLRKTFSGWPENRFQQWNELDFERYYPECFSDDVERVLAESDKQGKRTLKSELLTRVLDWIEKNEEEAKEEFRKSASEVIAKLQAVERELKELRFVQQVGSGA
jgi:hypothetical protein